MAREWYTINMRIYFSGIGGVGIGPLAEIALDAGYEVCGSDQSESLMARQLAERGVNVSYDQSGQYLREQAASGTIDRFVYTAALPRDHAELLAAEELGIPAVKRDVLLGEFIHDHQLKLIAVAGTHGKTTTTGMMVWALQQLGTPVSYCVGTTLGFGPSGRYDPASEYFVYECDEFDRNFLHFHPHLSLITAVDYDHPDTYPSEVEYMRAFMQFYSQSAHTIMWKDGLFGSHVPSSCWVLDDNETADLRLAGAHTRRNATLVQKACEYLGLGDATTALESFPGVDRRFERLADNLYSDYGHHPTEIAATLQMARELSDHVTLVYQPHQNIRQHEIRDQYRDHLELAETVYWLPTYLSREDPRLPILTPHDLIGGLANTERVHTAELDDELWQVIQDARRAGSLVLCMGAGSIDTWVRDMLTKSS